MKRSRVVVLGAWLIGGCSLAQLPDWLVRECPSCAAQIEREPASEAPAARLVNARNDLHEGRKALEVRAVAVCTDETRESVSCVENHRLRNQARAMAARLDAASVDPNLAIDWAAVRALLRAIVDHAMRTK